MAAFGRLLPVTIVSSRSKVAGQLLHLCGCNESDKYLIISFQLRFKTGVQAPPALQAELALQNTGKV
jgi:hypothetical protein